MIGAKVRSEGEACAFYQPHVYSGGRAISSSANQDTMVPSTRKRRHQAINGEMSPSASHARDIVSSSMKWIFHFPQFRQIIFE